MSVEAVHERLIADVDMAVAERPVGTDGAWVSGVSVNVPVTVVLADMVKEHVPVPEQPPPDQPAKVEPVVGVAVKVTVVPEVMVAVQVEPQEMPLPDMVPEPAPDLAAVRVYVLGGMARVVIWMAVD